MSYPIEVHRPAIANIFWRIFRNLSTKILKQVLHYTVVEHAVISVSSSLKRKHVVIKI